MMARHFEKSGELLFCYGSSDPPAAEAPETQGHHRVGMWLALVVFAIGMLFFAPYALG